MADLRHPARPVFHNESHADVTIHSDEESDAEEIEDYHKHETSAHEILPSVMTNGF